MRLGGGREGMRLGLGLLSRGACMHSLHEGEDFEGGASGLLRHAGSYLICDSRGKGIRSWH